MGTTAANLAIWPTKKGKTWTCAEFIHRNYCRTILTNLGGGLHCLGTLGRCLAWDHYPLVVALYRIIHYKERTPYNDTTMH